MEKEEKLRENEKVVIINYEPIYQQAFKKLNEDWISQYFKMEDTDYKSLDHPNEYVLDNGGAILIALYENEPVGACALIKMNEHRFELAKMAVAENARGKGMGKLLGKAAIKKAKELGATQIYLESNTVLASAINLYYKLGFIKTTGIPSPYERCNIQMLLDLE